MSAHPNAVIYTIAINEYQRGLIERALAAVCESEGYALRTPSYGRVEGDPLRDGDETLILRDLFMELPQDATTCSDDTVHGFCL